MDLSPERVTAFSDEQRARVLGAFYLFGGVVGALTLLAGSWPEANVGQLALLTTTTGLVGGVLMLVARFVPRRVCDSVVASGTIVIALCVVAAGGGAASASYQLYIVWTSLYVFIFYGTVVRIAHTAFSGLCLLLALVHLGEGHHAAASLVVTLGTCLGGGLIVGHLMAQVRVLAGTDPLTGAPNRRAAEQLMADAIARARRSGDALSIALLDLDRFKQVNDSDGHATGDRVLQDAVAAWREQLRGAGVVARLGGDEFVVVLEGCTEADALGVAERLVAVTPAVVGCSAGVALWDRVESDPQLLARCDEALYRAKSEGGGSILPAAPQAAAAATTWR